LAVSWPGVLLALVGLVDERLRGRAKPIAPPGPAQAGAAVAVWRWAATHTGGCAQRRGRARKRRMDSGGSPTPSTCSTNMDGLSRGRPSSRLCRYSGIALLQQRYLVAAACSSPGRLCHPASCGQTSTRRRSTWADAGRPFPRLRPGRAPPKTAGHRAHSRPVAVILAVPGVALFDTHARRRPRGLAHRRSLSPEARTTPAIVSYEWDFRWAGVPS